MGGGERPDELKIFQFWHSPSAPDEVDALMNTWRSDSAFGYERYSYEMADAFIAENFEAETLRAFRKCAVPAMQADFFRYCVLFVHGGIYLDADTRNGGGLSKLISDHDQGLLMKRKNRIANDFLFFRRGYSRLLEVVVERATWNVVNESGGSVWEVTGPGIMTSLYQAEGTRGFFSGFGIESVVEVRKCVRFMRQLDYKKKNEDWRHVRDEGRPIFIPSSTD